MCIFSLIQLLTREFIKAEYTINTLTEKLLYIRDAPLCIVHIQSLVDICNHTVHTSQQKLQSLGSDCSFYVASVDSTMIMCLAQRPE